MQCRHRPLRGFLTPPVGGDVLGQDGVVETREVQTLQWSYLGLEIRTKSDLIFSSDRIKLLASWGLDSLIWTAVAQPLWGHFNSSNCISISIWLTISCRLTYVLYRQNGFDAAEFTHPNELRGMKYEACETHGRYRHPPPMSGLLHKYEKQSLGVNGRNISSGPTMASTATNSNTFSRVQALKISTLQCVLRGQMPFVSDSLAPWNWIVLTTIWFCMSASCVVSLVSMSRTTTIHDRIRVLNKRFPIVSMNHVLHCQIDPKDQLFQSRLFAGSTSHIHTHWQSITLLFNKAMDWYRAPTAVVCGLSLRCQLKTCDDSYVMR